MGSACNATEFSCLILFHPASASICHRGLESGAFLPATDISRQRSEEVCYNLFLLFCLSPIFPCVCFASSSQCHRFFLLVLHTRLMLLRLTHHPWSFAFPHLNVPGQPMRWPWGRSTQRSWYSTFTNRTRTAGNKSTSLRGACARYSAKGCCSLPSLWGSFPLSREQKVWVLPQAPLEKWKTLPEFFLPP